MTSPYSVEVTSVVEIPTTVTVMDNTVTQIDVVELGVIGPQGIQGVQGVQGPQGLQGPLGLSGIKAQTEAPSDTTVVWVDTDDTGSQIIPSGGTTGQSLVKLNNTDYQVGWKTIPSSSYVGGLKAAFLGDSITNRSTAASNRGFIDQISKILGSAVISPVGVEIHSGTTNTDGVSINAGVPGNTSAQMLARYVTDVRAYSPQVLFLMAGTNDSGNSVSLATFASNISAIVALAKQDGIPVIISTVPPRSAAAGSSTIRSLISQYNIWLKMWCPRNGVYLADSWSKLITANTEVLKTGYDCGDGIHPESLGHQQIAEAFCTAFGSLHTANHLVTSTEAINLVSNPGFVSSTSGWYEQPNVSTGGAVAYSRVTDSSGKLAYGLWLQMDYSTISGGAGERFWATQINGLTAGNTYLITARFDYDDISGGFYDSASSTALPSDFAFELKDNNFANLKTLFSGSVKPPGPVMVKYVLPAGKTSLTLSVKGKLSANLNVKFRLGEVGVFDITNLSTISGLI